MVETNGYKDEWLNNNMARSGCLAKNNASLFSSIIQKKFVLYTINCFEIFLDGPSNLQAQVTTWSNYKHKNMAKVLIGITPQSVVSFVSDCWGGHVSGKYLKVVCSGKMTWAYIVA